MGMAASQARYLEITARKTNVEYEGQQVNQQRTALANESAGMFNQLMALEVPTPPSTSDFTSTVYAFNDGANDCTIDSFKNLAGDPNYNTTVSYSYTQPIYTGVKKARTDLGARLVTSAGDSTYWLTDGVDNKTKLTQCSATDANATIDRTAIEKIISDTGATSTFASDYGPTSDLSNIYKYTTNSGTTYYYGETDLSNMPPAGTVSPLTGYYAANINTKISETEKAYVTKAASGRYSTIELASEAGTTLSIAAETTTNQNAYSDAMNEYTYKQQAYEQQVTSINAKTEVIQQEDRTLELKLKQLDTEQEALQTEMESVKKVIDKNIESTFKTFAS